MFGAEADRNGRSYLHVSIYICASEDKDKKIEDRSSFNTLYRSLSGYWIWLLYGYECI